MYTAGSYFTAVAVVQGSSDIQGPVAEYGLTVSNVLAKQASRTAPAVRRSLSLVLATAFTTFAFFQARGIFPALDFDRTIIRQTTTTTITDKSQIIVTSEEGT